MKFVNRYLFALALLVIMIQFTACAKVNDVNTLPTNMELYHDEQLNITTLLPIGAKKTEQQTFSGDGMFVLESTDQFFSITNYNQHDISDGGVTIMEKSAFELSENYNDWIQNLRTNVYSGAIEEVDRIGDYLVFYDSLSHQLQCFTLIDGHPFRFAYYFGEVTLETAMQSETYEMFKETVSTTKLLQEQEHRPYTPRP